MLSRTRTVFVPALKAGFDRANLDAARRILDDPRIEGALREWAEEIVRKAEAETMPLLARRAGE